MDSVRLDLIQEIDRLWDPVYPYLARHISELYGRRDGDIVEIGPFCGVIFSLSKEKIGHSFGIAAFPEGMGNFFRQEVEKQNLVESIEIIETGPSLVALEGITAIWLSSVGLFFSQSISGRLLSRLSNSEKRRDSTVRRRVRQVYARGSD
jgi:hypothetical protein